MKKTITAAKNDYSSEKRTASKWCRQLWKVVDNWATKTVAWSQVKPKHPSFFEVSFSVYRRSMAKLFAPYLFRTSTSAKTIQAVQLTTTTVETRKKNSEKALTAVQRTMTTWKEKENNVETYEKDDNLHSVLLFELLNLPFRTVDKRLFVIEVVCDICRMAGLTFTRKMQGQLCARKYKHKVHSVYSLWIQQGERDI